MQEAIAGKEKNGKRDAEKFIIRMPPGMRDRIKFVAKANHRSMNAEIIARLSSSLYQTYLIESSGNKVTPHEILTPDEREILDWYRSLPKRKKEAATSLLPILSK